MARDAYPRARDTLPVDALVRELIEQIGRASCRERVCYVV